MKGKNILIDTITNISESYLQWSAGIIIRFAFNLLAKSNVAPHSSKSFPAPHNCFKLMLVARLNYSVSIEFILLRSLHANVAYADTARPLSLEYGDMLAASHLGTAKPQGWVAG